MSDSNTASRTRPLFPSLHRRNGQAPSTDGISSGWQDLSMYSLRGNVTRRRNEAKLRNTEVCRGNDASIRTKRRFWFYLQPTADQLSFSLFLSFSLSLSFSPSLSFSVYLGTQAARPRMQRELERFFFFEGKKRETERRRSLEIPRDTRRRSMKVRPSRTELQCFQRRSINCRFICY